MPLGNLHVRATVSLWVNIICIIGHFHCRGLVLGPADDHSLVPLYGEVDDKRGAPADLALDCNTATMLIADDAVRDG